MTSLGFRVLLCGALLTFAPGAVADKHGPKVETLVNCPTGDANRVCIRLGVTFSLTGKYKASGTAARDGLLLFAELANGKAETRDMESKVFEGSKFVADAPNYGIEVRYVDDLSEQSGVEAGYALLAKDAEVDFLIGPYGSTYGRAAAKIAEENSRIIVLPMSATDSVYKEEQKHVVGLFTPTSRYMSDMVALLKKAGAKTAVVLHSENFFAKSVAKSTKTACEAEGIEIKHTETYAADVPEGEEPHVRMEAALKKMCAAVKDKDKPDVLFIHALKHEGTPLVAAMDDSACAATPHKATVLTSAASDDNWVMEKRQEASRLCLLGSAQWRAMEGWSDPFLGSSVKVAELYRQRYNVEMRYEAGANMAAALLILEAHLPLEGTPMSTAERQVAVLEKVKTFKGTTFFGPIEFDAAGKNIGKPMLTTQVQDEGSIKVVAPDVQKDAELTYPCPASMTEEEKKAAADTAEKEEKETSSATKNLIALGPILALSLFSLSRTN